MAVLKNRARMGTATTGTGTITLGSAVDGYQSFADAGVTDGDVVRYVIEDGSAWEIGEGTYTASGTTLARSVDESSNADAAINLSGSAEVFIAAVAADVEGATVTLIYDHNIDGSVSAISSPEFEDGYDYSFEAVGVSHSNSNSRDLTFRLTFSNDSTSSTVDWIAGADRSSFYDGEMRIPAARQARTRRLVLSPNSSGTTPYHQMDAASDLKVKSARFATSSTGTTNIDAGKIYMKKTPVEFS
jgi:hypothetical protein